MRTVMLLASTMLACAGSLLAQEGAGGRQDTWLERFAAGRKTGWAHLVLEPRPDGGLRATREAWFPVEAGQVHELVETETDARGRVLRRATLRSEGGVETRCSVAALESGLRWTVLRGDLPPAKGQTPGAALDLDVVAWLLARGKLPRPAPGAAVRLLDLPGEGVVQVTLSVDTREEQLRIATPREVHWFSREGTLTRIELPDVVGGELRVVADPLQAADMRRPAPPLELPELSPMGLREPSLGVVVRCPGDAWELLRSGEGPGQVQIGLRHPEEVILLVRALPLAPPADPEGRRRVGRMLTHTLAAQRVPFELSQPEPVEWGKRPAIQMRVQGQRGAVHLRGTAWAIAGAHGGVFLLVAGPADQARGDQRVHTSRLAPLIEAARGAVIMEELPAKEPPWKQVALDGVGLTMEVPPAWEPTPDGSGFAAPGALLRFGGHRAPKLENLPRDAALEILVRQVREKMGARVVEEQEDRPVGGRAARRLLLEGQLPADQGGLATRVLYGFVPEEDGGVTILMGLAVESPEAVPTLQRVLDSVTWKR